MTEIKKENIIFQRGEGGKLIPQDAILENVDGKPTVNVVPLTRGKLQEIYAKATSENIAERTDADSDVIRNGLISPVLTEQEIVDMKPQIMTSIAQAILAVSLGVNQEDISKKTEEAIANQELVLKKK